MQVENPRKTDNSVASPVPRLPAQTGLPGALVSAIYHDTGFVAQTLLGQGESGQVILASEPATGEWRALKIFPRNKQPAFDKEVRALQRLSRSPHVVHMIRFLDFSKTRERNESDFGYIIMEVGRGNLLQLCGSRMLNEREARFLFLQMAEGVCAAHRSGFCHHDVKLENFVVGGEDGLVKLIDFGAALDLAVDLVNSPHPDERLVDASYVAGSPAYSSQQVLLGLPRSPEKTDIYGLGVSLYRLLCGHYPYCVPESDSLETLIRNVSRDNLEFPCALSEEARSLLRGMLAKREEDRLGWHTLARHPWIKKK